MREKHIKSHASTERRGLKQANILLFECRRCFPPLVLSRSGLTKGQEFPIGTPSQPNGSPSSSLMPDILRPLKCASCIIVVYEMSRALCKPESTHPGLFAVPDSPERGKKKPFLAILGTFKKNPESEK